MQSSEWLSLIRGDSLDGWEPDDPEVWSREGDALVIDAAGRSECNALKYFYAVAGRLATAPAVSANRANPAYLGSNDSLNPLPSLTDLLIQ